MALKVAVLVSHTGSNLRALTTAAERPDSAFTVTLVVTAGYMKKIGPATLTAYTGRILNIHPSLLPRHGGPGMHGHHVHESVLASGDTLTGASVHHLTAEYDEGPVIARQEVPVRPDDTPQTLAERVLAAEHTLLPATVQALAAAAPRG